jgi:hypothetical protein
MPFWEDECRADGAPTAGRGGQIMLGMPTQPFRAGLTFSGRPSGPRSGWSLRNRSMLDRPMYVRAEARTLQGGKTYLRG